MGDVDGEVLSDGGGEDGGFGLDGVAAGGVHQLECDVVRDRGGIDRHPVYLQRVVGEAGQTSRVGKGDGEHVEVGAGGAGGDRDGVVRVAGVGERAEVG